MVSELVLGPAVGAHQRRSYESPATHGSMFLAELLAASHWPAIRRTAPQPPVSFSVSAAAMPSFCTDCTCTRRTTTPDEFSWLHLDRLHDCYWYPLRYVPYRPEELVLPVRAAAAEICNERPCSPKSAIHRRRLKTARWDERGACHKENCAMQWKQQLARWSSIES